MAILGLGELGERLRRSTVQVFSGARGAMASGSGVIWASNGTLITNAHVVQGTQARVEIWDGRSFQASVASRDDWRDLALLKLPTNGLQSLPQRESATLRPGELVVAVGNPLGFVGALTTGVVHAAGPVRGLGPRPWIQAAIRLAPGNSGGPLADAQGSIVGINTMVVRGGLGLAIPSDTVLDFIKRGSTPRLGIAVQAVAKPAGLLVLEVSSKSPAENASLFIGDLLIGANGRKLRFADDLGAAIGASSGGVLKLRFLRGDRRAEREVSLLLPRSVQEAA